MGSPETERDRSSHLVLSTVCMIAPRLDRDQALTCRIHPEREGDAAPCARFNDLSAQAFPPSAARQRQQFLDPNREGHTTTNTTLIHVRNVDEVRVVRFGSPFPVLPEVGPRIGPSGTANARETPSRKAARVVRGEGFEPGTSVVSRHI